MGLSIGNLKRSSGGSAPTRSVGPPHPPTAPGLLIVMGGNAGEAVGLRLCALAWGDGLDLERLGINNDELPPRPLTVRLPDGSHVLLELTERLVLGGDNPRDRLRDYPLLDGRYTTLLRGVPVLETFPRAGRGGHAMPAVSGLDIDLAIEQLFAALKQALRRACAADQGADGLSDWQRLVEGLRVQAAVRRRLRILVIGGGCGSMGNAAHQLLPYLLRHLLDELGVADYELWGAILGPQAFTGLTPFTRANHLALLQAIDHMARHGQRRSYINGLTIDRKAPVYDRVFLLDDPNLPGQGQRVSPGELDSFFDRVALSLYLLLARGTVWQTVASHRANDLELVEDGRPRYLNTVRSVIADADRPAIRALLAARLEADLLAAVADRLTEGGPR